jgi:hypothetical protein
VVQRGLFGLAQHRSQPYAQCVFHDHVGLVCHDCHEVGDQIRRRRGGPRPPSRVDLLAVGGQTLPCLRQLTTIVLAQISGESALVHARRLPWPTGLAGLLLPFP